MSPAPSATEQSLEPSLLNVNGEEDRTQGEDSSTDVQQRENLEPLVTACCSS